MKFIIDTDPGTDDAVAILIALAHFTDEELLAITTVGGTVGVDVGTRNSLRILEHAKRNSTPPHDVPLPAQCLPERNFPWLGDEIDKMVRAGEPGVHRAAPVPLQPGKLHRAAA